MEPEMSVRSGKGVRIPLVARICELCEGQPLPGTVCDCIDGIEFWLPEGKANSRLTKRQQQLIKDCQGSNKNYPVDPIFIREAPDVYGNRREEA